MRETSGGASLGEPPSVVLSGVRALVLGATGFIGGRVVRALTAARARAIAVARDPVRAAEHRRQDVETVVCDVTSAEDVVRLIRDVRPDVTFNLAGYGVDRSERDADAAHRINAALPETLCRVLMEVPAGNWSGQRLVHVGSALEYGTATGDLDERTVPLPTTLYGSTKLAGTRAVAGHCARTGMRAVVARLFTVYGPGEHAGRLLPSLLETARTGAMLPLTAGTQRRDFTYVDDVAEGLLRLALAAAPPGEVLNLATGELETVRGFAERAARVLNIDAALLRFGAVAQRSEEMSHEPVAIRRLVQRTRWSPRTSIEAGVFATAREAGLAKDAG